jgi:hypothetical protein
MKIPEPSDLLIVGVERHELCELAYLRTLSAVEDDLPSTRGHHLQELRDLRRERAHGHVSRDMRVRKRDEMELHRQITIVGTIMTERALRKKMILGKKTAPTPRSSVPRIRRSNSGCNDEP